MAKRCVGCMKLKNNSPICEHCGYNENIPNESHQLPIGTVLQGRYQVGKKLGQGGFGITYIGWDQSLDSVVAIKEYYPNGLVYRDCAHSLAVVTAGSNVTELYSQNRERFLREAQILAELSHIPGIVRVQNLFTENNTAYIIMEYVDGITLKQYLLMQKRVMTTEELFHVMRTVMYALSKVHEAELVHRDISPDNIMIQKDGRVVLLDFGAARHVENAGVYKDLTHSTLAILKHGFAPIEQYRTRGNLGPWTDVYALCSTMYYCLTGVVPAAATERIMGDDNINWRQVPGLTAQQVAALEQGMAMLPEQRVGSIRELYDVLYGQRPVAEFSVQPKDTEPETVIETPTAPEVPAEKPVNKPAKSVGKKPVEYSSYTLNLEEPTPAPKTEMPSDPVPIVKEPKPDKKKKPVWIIAAVLAVMATAELFTMSQKDTKIVPETTVSITDTEGDLVPINSEDSWKNNLLEYPHLRFVDIYKDDIVSINFLDTLADAPQNSWDSSKENDGSVLAWVVKNEDKYDLYIAGEGGVNATGVCTSLFQDYINLETINFNDSFHSDNETYMINMFERCNNLISLDLSVFMVN